MPDEIDVLRLIAEVKNRPILWDPRYTEYKDRINTPHLWQEIADTLKVDVEHCKRKWKNLRDAYRAEIRRTERRMQRYAAAGHYEPKQMLTSKWAYFEPLSFINDSKRCKYAAAAAAASREPSASSKNFAKQQHEHAAFVSCVADVKREPALHIDELEDDADDEENDNMLFEEFQSVATPQAARRLSGTLNFAHSNENTDDSGHTPEFMSIGIGGGGAGAGSSSSNCKCNSGLEEQVNFLESLEREEQKLMQSTRQDISRVDTLNHVGDSDYNFLVSFLPQMKKMSELQNLQFRAKLSELVLNTMMSSAAAAVMPTATAANTAIAAATAVPAIAASSSTMPITYVAQYAPLTKPADAQQNPTIVATAAQLPSVSYQQQQQLMPATEQQLLQQATEPATAMETMENNENITDDVVSTSNDADKWF